MCEVLDIQQYLKTVYSNMQQIHNEFSAMVETCVYCESSFKE